MCISAQGHPYVWQNVQIILALVFESQENVKNQTKILPVAFSENSVAVAVCVFTMAQLEAQFGVHGQNED